MSSQRDVGDVALVGLHVLDVVVGGVVVEHPVAERHDHGVLVVGGVEDVVEQAAGDVGRGQLERGADLDGLALGDRPRGEHPAAVSALPDSYGFATQDGCGTMRM